MSRLKSCAAADPMDRESLTALFSNINLVMKHRKTILGTPGYRDIHVAGCGLSLLYVGPVRLSIGDLVRLWSAETFWLERDGQDTRYVFCVVGSLMSGRHQICCWSTLDNGFKYLSRGSGAFKAFHSARECRQALPTAGTDEIGPDNLPAASSVLTVADMISALKALGD